MNEAEWLTSADPARTVDFVQGRRDHRDRERFGLPVSDRKLRLWCAACQSAMTKTLAGEPKWSWQEWAENPAHNPRMTTEEAVRLWTRVDPGGSPTAAAKAAILRSIVGNPFAPVTLPPGPVCKRCKGAGKGPLGVGGAVQDRPRPACKACGGSGGGPSPWLTPDVQRLAEAAYCDRLTGDVVCVPCHGYGYGGYGIGGQTTGARCTHCHGAGRVSVEGQLDPARLAVLSDALEEAGCVGDKCDRCGGEGVIRHDDGWNSPSPCRPCGLTGRLPSPILARLRGPGPFYRGDWAVDLILGKE